MPPAMPDILRQAIARRMGVGTEPTAPPAPNPNVLKIMQLLRMAHQQNQDVDPGIGMGLPPGLAKRTELPPGLEKRTTLPPGLQMQQQNQMPPQQHPMGVAPVAPVEAITKLPQQHSQIGLQAPYQAFGGNPMQAAAQNRLKQGAGQQGNQGNFGGGYGGGSQTTPPGVNPKQDKHRKVTIEEYR